MVAVQTRLALVPRPQDGVVLAELDGEGVLYLPEKMAMIYLNESASVIWRLCDGHRTVANIIDALAEAFPKQTIQVSLDVPEMIELFLREGMLELGEA